MTGQKSPFSSVPGGSIGGARHKTGPSTTFDPIPPTIPAFHEKPQAFYLRFSFRITCRGRGLPPKRSRWAHFVADGSRGSPRKAKMIRSLRPREFKGCYGYGAISKLCRFTTIKTRSPITRDFFAKMQAVYLRFWFCRMRCGWG